MKIGVGSIFSSVEVGCGVGSSAVAVGGSGRAVSVGFGVSLGSGVALGSGVSLGNSTGVLLGPGVIVGKPSSTVGLRSAMLIAVAVSAAEG